MFWKSHTGLCPPFWVVFFFLSWSSDLYRTYRPSTGLSRSSFGRVEAVNRLKQKTMEDVQKIISEKYEIEFEQPKPTCNYCKNEKGVWAMQINEVIICSDCLKKVFDKVLK